MHNKGEWLKNNKNALVALALLIIVIIGSVFTSSWYNSSETLKTSTAKTANIGSEVSDVNKKILSEAINIYNAGTAYTCSGYVDAVLQSAGILNQDSTPNTSTWYHNSNTININDGYELEEIASGIADGIAWYDAIGNETLMPGDIIIRKKCR